MDRRRLCLITARRGRRRIALLRLSKGVNYFSRHKIHAFKVCMDRGREMVFSRSVSHGARRYGRERASLVGV